MGSHKTHWILFKTCASVKLSCFYCRTAKKYAEEKWWTILFSFYILLPDKHKLLPDAWHLLTKRGFTGVKMAIKCFNNKNSMTLLLRVDLHTKKQEEEKKRGWKMKKNDPIASTDTIFSNNIIQEREAQATKSQRRLTFCLSFFYLLSPNLQSELINMVHTSTKKRIYGAFMHFQKKKVHGLLLYFPAGFFVIIVKCELSEQLFTWLLAPPGFYSRK